MVTEKEQILIFKSTEGPSVNVTLEGETVWLTQAQMVTLFQRDQSVISRHISAVFNEKELYKKSNMQKLHIANSDKPVVYYSLDVIISVGYRIKSHKGTQFRIWANKILKQYLINGYAINEKHLKEHTNQIKLLEAEINNIKSSHLIDHKLISEKINQLSHQVKSFSEILDEFQGENVILRRPEGGWYEG